MEEVCCRFPHVASMILKDLDNHSLVESIMANRELCNFITNDRIYWTRIIAKYRTNFMKFKASWRRSLCQVPAVKIKELAIAAHEFFKYPQSRLNKQWSPLHIVAHNGSVEFYKYICKKCGCINHVGDDGVTAIHMAATPGNLEIVKFIIDNFQNQNESAVQGMNFGDQIDINPRKADGRTPLHFAAESGHFETCKFILKLLTNKNPRDKEGLTPLHDAVLEGHDKVYELIMEDLEDKNPGDNFGVTPLHLASYFNQPKTVKLIMCHLQDKNPEGMVGVTPLQVAAEFGHLEVVKLFVEHPEVKILFDGSYKFLHSAARYGNHELCKLLIENSKRKNYVDRSGWTPLHYAATNGHFAICELLFPYFADKYYFNDVWTFGHFAMKNGDSRYWQEIGKGLKSVGPKTNAGTTPLQLMALNFDVMKAI